MTERRGPGAVPFIVVIAMVTGLLGACHDSQDGTSELLRYVSLGDSFPAGVGLPGGSPPCRRSPQAYPDILARTTDLLPSLHACTGATTEDLLEGEGPEGRQLDWVTADTDVVTITVGGNDLGFARVIGDCLLGAAPCSRLDGETDNRIAALAPRLLAVNEEIRARAPAARVLLVGYPQLVADPRRVDIDGCPELAGSSPERRITADEAEWLRQQGEALAEVMRAAAASAGARYVDAAAGFSGHEACTPSPWMVGVAANDLTASFHPNAAGHEALARLIAGALDLRR